MLHVIDCDCHSLLQQPILFELIGVYQRADQTSIAVFVMVLLQLYARRFRREGIIGIVVGFRGRRLGCWVRLAGLEVPLASFGCSLLLAWGKGTVELSVYEEIGQDPTRAPWDSVCPALDPRSSLLVHKDVSAHDELAPLPVMRSTKAVGKCTRKACLEDN